MTRPPRLLRVVSLCASLVFVATIGALSGAGPADASCGATGSKSIAGTLSGDDGRAVNALVGFTFVDEFGYRLDARGCRLAGDAYGRTFHLNAALPASGAKPSAATSNQFRIDGIPANVKEVWVETYPKGPDGRTSYGHYAGVYRPQVAPGTTNLNLKLPVVCGQGGHTGTIVAKVFVAGRPVSPTWLAFWSESSTSPQMGYALGNGSTGGFTSPPLSSTPAAAGQPQRYQVFMYDNGRMLWHDAIPVYACRITTVRIDVP